MVNENGTVGATEKQTNPPKRNLHERDLEVYRQSLDVNLEEGLARFGFALFHSLPLDERALYREALGLACQDAVDHYNLGGACASREDFERAIACWREALRMDPSLCEAEFNIALAYERMNDLAKARKHFKHYRETATDPEEKQAVENHLAEMGA